MDGLRAWKTVFTEWNPWVLFDDTIFQLGLDRKDFDLCMAGIGRQRAGTGGKAESGVSLDRLFWPVSFGADFWMLWPGI